MFKKKLMTLVGVLLMGFGSNTALAVPVDVELQLLVDVSGSIDASEYTLQMNGYRDAFQSAAVQNAVANGVLGTIAVQLIQWSGAAEQFVSLGWTQLTTAAEMNAFGNAIAATARIFAGSTAPGSAITFGLPEFFGNGFEGTKKVMDVSGDGIQNSGTDTMTARDNALANGIDQINGLTIGDVPGLQAWYQANVVGGAGAFQMHATDFATFAGAVKTKLERDITGVPAPDALGLMGFGLVMMGMAAARRRRQLP
ncbi:DUF1194 domain-containing protein [Paremcibacter congregatus]|uniref:DUF1194 domain-containing protein n=1 Tax=Paremcibacter congregatus TaxID=2043170 RepID=UPI0030EF9C40|tara:strand:- start:7447 stop:8208 length:762 start_codon:yes stop_codon:yes gene_type:complete